jgi:hypothetical protein
MRIMRLKRTLPPAPLDGRPTASFKLPEVSRRQRAGPGGGIARSLLILAKLDRKPPRLS